MQKITLTEIDLQELVNALRPMVEDVVRKSGEASKQERYLTTRETCNMLNISRVTLGAWVKQSKIKEYRINGKNLYKYSDLETAMKVVKKYN